jgi:hypothetical protein
MNEVIELLVWAFVGYLIAKVTIGLIESYLIQQAELHTQLVDKLTTIIHVVKVEQYGDITYWFDNDTDQFIAQGKTDDEIISVLKSRFSEHIFILPAQEKILTGPEFQFQPMID